MSSLSNGARIYVDYAHTPDALNAVLCGLRRHVTGRIVLVFGCGGDRDQGKRELMGRVSQEHADMVLVTDDNPRTEDAASIREMILRGVPNALEIGDRRDAIEKGMSLLQEGDVLLIAGKGHECGQIIGEQIYPFDDCLVVQEILHVT